MVSMKTIYDCDFVDYIYIYIYICYNDSNRSCTEDFLMLILVIIPISDSFATVLR